MVATLEIVHKILPATFVKSAKSEKGFTATITSEIVDSDGEVLLVSGMNSARWEKTPLFCWNHDIEQVIGRGTALRTRKTYVEADFEFAPRPAEYVGEWFPDYARGLVESGCLRAVSVGLVAQKGGLRRAIQADKDRFGPDCQAVFNSWKLLEVSLVPLGSNEDALISAVYKGLLTRSQVKRFARIDVPDAPIVPKRRAITVAVPEFGEEDRIKSLVRAEIRRMQGRMYA